MSDDDRQLVPAARTGGPVKALREYQDMRLIYTVGRTTGNYGLFDEEALWCVGVVGGLRRLGLTLAEIRDLAERQRRSRGGNRTSESTPRELKRRRCPTPESCVRYVRTLE